MQPEGRQERVYVYMPTMKKVQRVTARTALSRLWGTDFSPEDLRFLLTALKDVTVSLRGEGEVEGRSTHVLESVLDVDAGSPYERVVSHVDAESCVALRTEFFEAGESPRKVLGVEPDTITQDGERYRATRYEMVDNDSETRTTLTVERVEFDLEIDDSVFSPKRLGEVQ